MTSPITTEAIKRTATCIDCGGPRGRRSKARCRDCSYRHLAAMRRKPKAFCIECEAEITRQSKSGRCQPCATRAVNQTEELKAARAAGIRRKFKDPAHREKMAQVMRENGAKARRNPIRRRALVLRGREQYRAYLSKPDVRARNLASRRKNSWKITEAHIGWCPRPYRELYRFLRRSKRMNAPEARSVVEKQIAADTAGLDPLAAAIKIASMPK